MSGHVHSAEALAGEVDSGRLGRRAHEVLVCVSRAGRPLTDREVAAALGFADMNAVRPRITELLQDGWLREVDEVVDQVTGKLVRRVAPPARSSAAGRHLRIGLGQALPRRAPREQQLELFAPHIGKGGRA